MHTRCVVLWRLAPSPALWPGLGQPKLLCRNSLDSAAAQPAQPTQPSQPPAQPSPAQPQPSQPSPAQPVKKNLLKTFEFPQTLNNFSAMMPVPVSSANSTHCPAQAAADTRLIAVSQETTRQVYVRIMHNHMRCKKLDSDTWLDVPFRTSDGFA